jgi:hypothetical protein
MRSMRRDADGGHLPTGALPSRPGFDRITVWFGSVAVAALLCLALAA